MEVEVFQWEEGEGDRVLAGKKNQNSLCTCMKLSKECKIIKWNNVDEYYQTVVG